MMIQNIEDLNCLINYIIRNNKGLLIKKASRFKKDKNEDVNYSSSNNISHIN